MATAHDVAAFVLQAHGSMTAMKLQKLVYYAQAWHLVWEDRPLFEERIEAWANGPVCPDLYRQHAGSFEVRELKRGNPDALAPEERSTVAAILEFYGTKSSQWLSDLTHLESPWRDSREGLKPGERGSEEITTAAMAEYYGSL